MVSASADAVAFSHNVLAAYENLRLAAGVNPWDQVTCVCDVLVLLCARLCVLLCVIRVARMCCCVFLCPRGLCVWAPSPPPLPLLSLIELIAFPSCPVFLF